MTLPLGYDGELLLLALDREDDAARAIAGLQRAVADRDVPAGAVGVSFPDDVAADAVRAAGERGLVRVVAVDAPGDDALTFAHGDAFGRHIDALEPELSSVRVRWHPGDAPDVKKQRALGLTKLGAWLHETERSLLIELIVPPTDDDLARVDGDRTRYATELRPAAIQDAIVEIRQLGVEADVWGTEGVLDPADAIAIGDLVRDEGRDRVGIVTLLAAAPDGGLALRASRASDACRGFVLPATSGADPSGAPPDLTADVAGRFGHHLDLYTAAAPA